MAEPRLPGMEVRRTVRITLDVAPEASELLHETIDQFLMTANAVADTGWSDEGSLETRRIELHERTYDAVRETTDLHAHLVQAARNRAAEALASAAARRDDGRTTGKPTFTSRTVRYTTESATINRDHATLATVAGRVRVDFRLPTDPDGTPHAAYLHDDSHEVTGADLVYDTIEDRFELHVRTKATIDPEPVPTDTDADASRPSPMSTAEHRTVLGLTVGSNIWQLRRQAGSGTAGNYSTGVRNSSVVARPSSSVGHDGHTTQCSASVGARRAIILMYSIPSRRTSSPKHSLTTVRSSRLKT